MFFDDISLIQKIAIRCGTSLFVIPDDVVVKIPEAIVLEPDEKTVITIDQVRKVMMQLELKQKKDIFVIIRPAEKLQLEAANAFLKSLEEPGEHVHYLLITARPSMLLPTILSRAEMYCLKGVDSGEIRADERTKDLAKRLLVARPAQLVDLANEIARKKESVRAYALEVVGIAIEMLYRSYFITGKDVFIKKLPKFLTLYEHLSQNGHIKLQIVASLV